MTETAELGAEDGVGSGSSGSEVDVDRLTGYGVLFEAHLGDGEAMDNVLCVKAKVYFAVRGKDEFGGNEVVGSMRIRWVYTDWVAFAGGDQLGLGCAEGGIDARVAEIPGELHSCDLNLECGGVGTSVARARPKAFGFYCKGGEEDREGGQR